MKASPLLRAWLARLDASGVAFKLRHQWRGWDGEGALMFRSPEGDTWFQADAVVLALGGASWPKLGSDGSWQEYLGSAGIEIAPLVPSNCGFIAGWSEQFGERFQGQPLKGIALHFADKRVRGEAIITRAGLEGGAVYALSGPMRDAIASQGEAVLHVDLRPDVNEEKLETSARHASSTVAPGVISSATSRVPASSRCIANSRTRTWITRHPRGSRRAGARRRPAGSSPRTADRGGRQR
jgi:predicted flavoprotein YhiN